ncbi:SRPBCC family protein [Streptantibioticus ferralitis]|uniref:SRPBCC family protein n=1 Tax=Streptantibioticus ferralitis TaxID=236510 RepID=A0ABT5YTN3_9ACTN|nr:SRPBCC family protein [Streptantibioticus ferralitis]MDF2254965.1 SRPBCC family protein [Streptantibioticus ferralitis]
MSTIEKQIDVSVPADVAWDCLHSVESYPQFVDGVREARPEGKRRAHLDLEGGGKVREVDAEITDRAKSGTKGNVMLWHTAHGEGAELKGAFTVRAIDDQHTQVQVRVEYDPEKTRDTFGGPKGFAQSDAIQELVQHDLEKFKDLVEHQR